jgi:hypothetical protein
MTALAPATARELDAFHERIRGVPYGRKGVIFSDMFFLSMY